MNEQLTNTITVFSKPCTKCKEIKLLNEFPVRKDSKDGHRNSCIICYKQWFKQHYSEHKEEKKLSSKKWRIEHIEECKQNRHEHHMKHREEDNLKSRQWYSEHIEKCKLNNKQWYSVPENKEKHNLKSKQRHLEHKDEDNLKSRQHYSTHKEEKKQNYVKNIDKIKLQKKQHHIEHREEDNLRTRQWYVIPENKEKVRIQKRQYQKERIEYDEGFRMRRVLSNTVHRVLKGNTKSAHTMELIGCTIEEFIIYLKKHFKPGMTLANRGLRKWHLHHIKYCHTFDLSDPEQQKRCFHYTNMIPMWADEHRKLHRNKNSHN